MELIVGKIYIFRNGRMIWEGKNVDSTTKGIKKNSSFLIVEKDVLHHNRICVRGLTSCGFIGWVISSYKPEDLFEELQEQQ